MSSTEQTLSIIKPNAVKKNKIGMVIALLEEGNLKVIKAICHEVLVMREGEVVESGSAEVVLNNPKHEYTRLLVDAVL